LCGVAHWDADEAVWQWVGERPPLGPGPVGDMEEMPDTLTGGRNLAEAAAIERQIGAEETTGQGPTPGGVGATGMIGSLTEAGNLRGAGETAKAGTDRPGDTLLVSAAGTMAGGGTPAEMTANGLREALETAMLAAGMPPAMVTKAVMPALGAAQSLQQEGVQAHQRGPTATSTAPETDHHTRTEVQGAPKITGAMT